MSGDEAVAFITVLTDIDAYLVDSDASSDPGYQVEAAPWDVDLQGAVDRGDTANLDATARASSAMRCDRAFRRAVGASGLENNLDLRDQVLVELIRDLLRGKRSEEDALSAGLRHIREAHRPRWLTDTRSSTSASVCSAIHTLTCSGSSSRHTA